MKVVITPSDLAHHYPRKDSHRGQPLFRGVPDAHYFDRTDLFEVITMLAAVMEALPSADRRVLGQLEELLRCAVPPFLKSREDVFHFLLAHMRENLGGSDGSLAQ